MAKKKKKLLLIESPNKIHTLTKILGDDYIILATAGHIRFINDSGAYKIGVDTKDNFKIDYVFDPSKKDIIDKIKKAAKEVDVCYLAADPDREGELISDEMREILKPLKKKIYRIRFNEITKKAVENAIANPVEFQEDLISAANARNALDKIIGYRTSSLALSKCNCPSAGRVQSALLRLICEKEEAIRQFKPVKYWEVFLNFKKGKKVLSAKLYKVGEKKTEKLDSEKEANDIVENCKKGKFIVKSIETKTKLVEPKLPLTTSALQQLASSVLGFSPAKTQGLAQTLYEKAYITYIRSDAVRYSDEFLNAAKDHICNNYEKKIYNGFPKVEAKQNTQDGHESIHPTNLNNDPISVVNKLDPTEWKLYNLIYNYSLAALCIPAKIDETTVIIENGVYQFKLVGKNVTLESFLKIIDDIDSYNDPIPKFEVGEELKNCMIAFEEKETQGPQRYSEAGLVKLMDSSGIGRPSTYTPTIETLKKREYISIDKKAVFATEKGLKLYKMLKTHFDNTFNTTYTAEMETDLDRIANGEETYLSFLTDFWKEFEPTVLKAAREINKEKPKPKEAGMNCPQCGKPLVFRQNKQGKDFVCCSGFPRCRFTAATLEDVSKKPVLKQPTTRIQCPVCGDGYMVERVSKKGDHFWGCSRFSKGCKSTMSQDEMDKYLEKLKKSKKKDLSEDNN